MKLVLSHNFHRAANEHQRPVINQLINDPAHGCVTLLSDWKELLALPIMWKAINIMTVW